MNALTIRAARPADITLLSNTFVDRYMPRANGEFVKVYIHTLRCSSAGLAFSPASAADRLHCTEQDILRALKYWENEGLLALSYSADGTLTGIDLDPASPAAPGMSAPGTPGTPDSAVGKEVSSSPDRQSFAGTERTPENDEELRALVLAIEQYMKAPLSAADLSRLLYFYNTLHFSTDLLEYLIEYCVDSGHRSIRYIEKVGISWYERGIRTVDAARREQRARKEYYSILAALGITGRSPVEAEIRLMDTWLSDYGFPMDVIEEACSRTVLNTKQPSLKYADGILSRWHTAGVKALKDIDALDSAHEERKRTAADKTASPSGNRFNRFEQHDYDFDAIEKQLIKLQQ